MPYRAPFSAPFEKLPVFFRLGIWNDAMSLEPASDTQKQVSFCATAFRGAAKKPPPRPVPPVETVFRRVRPPLELTISMSALFPLTLSLLIRRYPPFCAKLTVAKKLKKTKSTGDALLMMIQALHFDVVKVDIQVVGGVPMLCRPGRAQSYPYYWPEARKIEDYSRRVAVRKCAARTDHWDAGLTTGRQSNLSRSLR